MSAGTVGRTPGPQGSLLGFSEQEEQAIETGLHRRRIQAEVERRFQQERIAAQWKMADWRTQLTDDFEVVDDMPIPMTVEGLHPTGANTLPGAQYKAGKTTLLINLFRSLLDGEPFLGQYAVNFTGRVCYWNYELTEQQFISWLRRHGIRNTDRASVLNLRGHPMPLLVPEVREEVIDRLWQYEIKFWIIDPYSKAYRGPENDNEKVGQWLDNLDLIKQSAGIPDLVMAAHFGRAEHEEGNEHVRGATVLDDWADVRWLLTKDKEENRYFRADGRDVQVDETRLTFDETTGRLTVVGGSRSTAAFMNIVDEVVAAVANKPGITTRELRDLLSGKNATRNSAITWAGDNARIRSVMDGRRKCHYPVPAGPQVRLGD